MTDFEKLEYETIGTFVQRLERLGKDDKIALTENYPDFIQVSYDENGKVTKNVYVKESADWNVIALGAGTGSVSGLVTLLKKFLPMGKDRAVATYSNSGTDFISKTPAATTTFHSISGVRVVWESCHLKDLKSHEMLMKGFHQHLSAVRELGGDDPAYLYGSVVKLAAKYPSVTMWYAESSLLTSADEVTAKYPKSSFRAHPTVKNLQVSDADFSKLNPGVEFSKLNPGVESAKAVPSEELKVYMVDTTIFDGLPDLMKVYNLTEKQVGQLFQLMGEVYKCRVSGGIMDAFLAK